MYNSFTYPLSTVCWMLIIKSHIDVTWVSQSLYSGPLSNPEFFLSLIAGRIRQVVLYITFCCLNIHHFTVTRNCSILAFYCIGILSLRPDCRSFSKVSLVLTIGRSAHLVVEKPCY